MPAGPPGRPRTRRHAGTNGFTGTGSIKDGFGHGTQTASTFHGLPALDADTGQERWNLTSVHLCVLSPVAMDGTPYIGRRKHLLAIDAATGGTRWKRATHYAQGMRPAVADGTVYTACADGFLWTVDAETGRKQWKLRLRSRRLLTTSIVNSGRRRRDQGRRHVMGKGKSAGVAWSPAASSRGRRFVARALLGRFQLHQGA
ncbi:PQQ-binding-like beta-propeller repeat protein [Streptomyces sp. NPDC050549]|uniref:outer membrane protein assembly factor BamB family protein n=1 Tax=Streptomyces sp. NPDC050549 TaxID=3155406 RepID=UPI003430418D